MEGRETPELLEAAADSVRYIEVKPKQLDPSLVHKVRPNYQMASDLFLAQFRLMEREGSDFSSQNLLGLARNPVLEKAEYEDPYSHRITRPKEIADFNFQEMERATALKWRLALTRFFSSEHFNRVPIHRPDGRLQIAVPGCALGLEIGGVVDFFNDLGIPVDVEAVDIGAAGGEQKFMNLEERQKARGSKVNFHPQTDAREFFEGRRTDIAILRHPGFFFEADEYYAWKKIIETIANTRPGIIIASTYMHSLKDDPLYIESVLKMPPQKNDQIWESQILDNLLAEQGYVQPNEHLTVDSELLQYPMSPYLLAGDKENGKFKFTIPVDREIMIYGSPEYLASKK